VVIDNFDIVRVMVFPDKAYAVLSIDPNIVLPGAVIFQDLQAIAGGAKIL
jgi:hypothetical protein